MDTSDWGSMVEIHVLLVDHETNVHAPLIHMLEQFFLKVTTVNYASTGLDILEKGEENFDLLLENIHSPDGCGYQLLHQALNMDLPVILLFEEDDVMLTKMGLEDGALLCIKKPIKMEMAKYLWQLVVWEKTRRRKENEMMNNINGVGELNNFTISGNANSEESHNNNTKIEIKCESSSSSDMASLRGKVWTEWTQELHDKFMSAVRQLGVGRCYPRDILELMNEPGLTRMQVASHLQKCRSGSWIAPSKRKAKRSGAKRASRRKLGFMPASLSNSNSPQIHHQTPNQYNSSSLENKVFDDCIPFPHVTFKIRPVDWGVDDTGLYVSDAHSFTDASPNQTDYIEFEFPNMDSSFEEEVPINYNVPVMKNEDVEELEKDSKYRDDDGKTQVEVKKEE